MAKSSMPRRALPPLILIVAPGALAAQSVAPEEAIARQQAEISEVVSQVCPTGTNPDDPNNVVVCGRREQVRRYRVPAELAEGSRRRETAGGEQLRVMGAGSERCSTIGPVLTCARGIDVLTIGGSGTRLFSQKLDEED